jgi:hypothetical protein
MASMQGVISNNIGTQPPASWSQVLVGWESTSPFWKKLVQQFYLGYSLPFTYLLIIIFIELFFTLQSKVIKKQLLGFFFFQLEILRRRKKRPECPRWMHF